MEKNLVHSNLDFLKILEKYTLESKLLACQKYSSRIMSSSMVDMRKVYKENIMPWEIEAFAAYSLVYDNDDATEVLDGRIFAETITLIRNYWHKGLTAAEESGEYPEVFMMISALQQFPVQGVFLQKLYRYHYFFTFQNSNLNMRKVFFYKMGVNYEQLEEFAFLIFFGFSKEVQDELAESGTQKILQNAFSDKDALQLLSIDKEDYKKELFSLYKDNIVDQYYGLKIQYLYPFISEEDFTYIIVFYDTKAIAPGLKLRKFDTAEIEKDIEIYAKDVIQIYNQINNYLQGLFQLDKLYSKNNIFGIVVVLEDAVVSRKKVYEKVYEILENTETLTEENRRYICSPIKILPLRAIECMVLQNTSLLPELTSQLEKPERWYDYTYTNTTTENGVIPLYGQYEKDIKNRIAVRINS